MTAEGIPGGSFAERLTGTSDDAQALYADLLPAFAAPGTPPRRSR